MTHKSHNALDAFDKIPTRKEILEKFDALIKGTLSPEQVAQWAAPWDEDECDIDTEDVALLTALGQLSGAAFKNSPNGPYVFNSHDFKRWLKEFETACAQNPVKE